MAHGFRAREKTEQNSQSERDIRRITIRRRNYRTRLAASNIFTILRYTFFFFFFGFMHARAGSTRRNQRKIRENPRRGQRHGAIHVQDCASAKVEAPWGRGTRKLRFRDESATRGKEGARRKKSFEVPRALYLGRECENAREEGQGLFRPARKFAKFYRSSRYIYLPEFHAWHFAGDGTAPRRDETRCQ